MTWLVTGGAGFLGVHLLRSLVCQGVPARSLDLVRGAPEGVEEIVGDVRDEHILGRVLDGVDVLVHAAAALPSGGPVENANVVGAERLARAASRLGVSRAILVSSAVVYGLGRSPLSESDEPRPIEPYGRSKMQAEEIWLRTVPAPVVLRPAAFLGPERLGVFGILFRWIRENRRIYVLGDGSNRYQLLDVSDLVSAILLAGACDAQGVLNVGGRVSGTVREDLESLIGHARSTSRVVGLPARPARVVLSALGSLRLSPLSTWHVRSADRDFVLGCDRAAEALGWSPEHSGAEALARAFDWYVEAGSKVATGTTHRTAWRERGLAALRRFS